MNICVIWMFLLYLDIITSKNEQKMPPPLPKYSFMNNMWIFSAVKNKFMKNSHSKFSIFADVVAIQDGGSKIDFFPFIAKEKRLLSGQSLVSNSQSNSFLFIFIYNCQIMLLISLLIKTVIFFFYMFRIANCHVTK